MKLTLNTFEFLKISFTLLGLVAFYFFFNTLENGYFFIGVALLYVAIIMYKLRMEYIMTYVYEVKELTKKTSRKTRRKLSKNSSRNLKVIK